MHSHHNTYLVVLSYVIATMSAYVSIDLARRVMYSSRTAKYVWLIAGAGTLGIGIWSMHFIAMLAFQFPVPIYYDAVLVVLSVLIAIVGCFLGFTIISRNTKSSSRFILSGIIMGLSIAAMHYVGMAAVKPVTITYNLLLVIVSIVIAISASWVAIGLGFRSSNTAQGMPFGLKAVFSLIMAVAIAGMHYTGMAATQFTDHGHPAVPASDMDTSLLAWIVAGLTVLVFTLFFFSLIFDRVWKRKEILQKTLLDSIADGIVITDQSGRILHVNPAFLQLAGGHLKHPHLQQYHPGLVPDAELPSGLQVELNSMVFEVKRRPVIGEALHQSLWLFHDLTERIQNERQITYMAYHDALTQLPNRHRVDVVLNEWRVHNQSGASF